MDLNISEVSNEHKLFQGWGFDHVHFYGKHFHFLLTFPLLNSESFALFEKEEPNFHICCRKQQRKGKKKLWKKEFVFVKNSSQSFFPSTLFSVFKANSIKIFGIFLKNKPVSNDIYNEVVELNPSLLYKGHIWKIPCPSKTLLLPICWLCACKGRERVLPFFSRAGCTVHGFA